MAKKTKKTAPATPKTTPRLVARPASPEGYLGMVVADKVTGFQGTVGAIFYMLSGCIQAHLIPKVDKDGKLGDGFAIDLDRLDVVGPGPMPPTPAYNTDHIKLGVTAADLVTGAEGTLTEKAVYINGCTSFVLTSKSTKKEERTIAVDWKRLSLAGSRAVVPLPVSQPNQPPRGGPMRRIRP